MGWTTARTRHKLHMLKYWNRLLDLPDSRITHHVFQWDRDFYYNKRGSWSNAVKSVFSEIECNDLFQSN